MCTRKAVIISLVWTLQTMCLGYDITSCGSNGKQDVQENQTTIFNCTGIAHAYSQWQIQNPDGTRHLIASCNWTMSGFNGTCPEAFDDRDILVKDDYKATSFLGDKTELYLNGNDRARKFASVRCSGGSTSGTILGGASCGIRYVYPANYLSGYVCNMTYDPAQRSASGSCEVTKVYASDGLYSCGWTQRSPSGEIVDIPGTMNLTSFTENGLQYQQGSCFFINHAVNGPGGNYSYSMWIDPDKHTIYHTGLYLAVEGSSIQTTTTTSSHSTMNNTDMGSTQPPNNSTFASNTEPRSPQSHETEPTTNNDRSKDDISGEQSEGPPIGTIVGGTVGGLALLVSVAFNIVCIFKRKALKNFRCRKNCCCEPIYSKPQNTANEEHTYTGLEVYDQITEQQAPSSQSFSSFETTNQMLNTASRTSYANAAFAEGLQENTGYVNHQAVGVEAQLHKLYDTGY